MKWLTHFLTSSIGKKVIMSFTGLFLISFLLVHLLGNLQLLQADSYAFNAYAAFMTSNPLIKTVSIGLYAGIILHAVQGTLLWLQNRKARGGSRYAVNRTPNQRYAARQMMILGTLILAFLFLHMGDFWYTTKFGVLENAQYDATTYKQIYAAAAVNPDPTLVATGNETPVEYRDLYRKVYASFKNPWIVAAYLVGLLALAFHLWHGFQSAFQTLGLNHKKYTPLLVGLGYAFSIIVPLVYAAIPIYMYFFMDNPNYAAG